MLGTLLLDFIFLGTNGEDRCGNFYSSSSQRHAIGNYQILPGAPAYSDEPSDHLQHVRLFFFML
jgi:hypothetical protein